MKKYANTSFCRERRECLNLFSRASALFSLLELMLIQKILDRSPEDVPRIEVNINNFIIKTQTMWCFRRKHRSAREKRVSLISILLDHCIARAFQPVHLIVSRLQI